MDQNDFRRLLSTGSSSKGKREQYGGKRNLSEHDLEEVRQLSRKKPKKPSKKSSKSTQSTSESESTVASNYRDRAAERRSGATTDMIDAEEYSHLDTNQSKFLGGDLEHTHLVKGLDYALLEQLKREKEKLQETSEKNRAESSRPAGRVSDEGKKDEVVFHSRLGRLVHYYGVERTAPRRRSVEPVDAFLPGRTFYTFRLTGGESVPSIVQRSKEDCVDPDEVVSGIVDPSLIDRVRTALSLKPRRSRKKVEKPKEEKVETMVVEETEDIFKDVGDYVPVDQRSSSDSTLMQKENTKSYFDGLSASISDAREEEVKRQEENKDEWKYALKRAIHTRAKEEVAKQQKREVEVEEYGAVDADTAYDSEDDEMMTTRKKELTTNDSAGRKKQKLQSELDKMKQMPKST